MMIKCDTCPRCKDTYPDKVDFDGNHFHIHYSISSCGLYESIEDALSHMTESEIRRWKENK